MDARRPPLVLAAAAVLLVTVLAAFATAVMTRGQHDRREAENRLQDRSALTAAVTESILATIANQGAADRGVRLGGPRVTATQIDDFVERIAAPYGVLVDSRGEVVAAGSSVPPEVLEVVRTRPKAVRDVLAGAPFALSDMIPPESTGTTFFAVPVPRPSGGRVFVQGVIPEALATFLGSYLEGIPGVRRARAYVVEAGGRVLGAGSPTERIGRPPRRPGLAEALTGRERNGAFRSAGEDHRFASAPIGGTRWRVVLEVRASDLYGRSGATLPWLILATLGLAGVAVLILLRRTLRSAQAVVAANDRLKRSNADLEHSNDELQRSNAELEQFASVASHDLQEPLRKINAFGDQIEQRFGGDLDPEALDHLRRMRGAARRMSTLIDDILRFSRVTTRAQPPQAVDLRALAHDVIDDLETTIAEVHGTVSVGALPVVDADPQQMRQLLQNLIVNALKFHRPAVAPVVDLQPMVAPGPGLVAFRVTDEGIGFAPQYQERIFRVFERLHPRDVYAGTGIGLALCRKIVERHGGTITAAGAEGAGASFTVVLQAARPSPEGGGRPVPVAPDREIAARA